MKKHLFVAPIILISFAAAGWHAMGETSSDPTNLSESAKEQRMVERLELAEERVRTRIGIAPAMEIRLENGKDPVEEARALGLIIEASLEEVEAALEAAAATPDTADDIAAQRLRHRGSYRFYSDAESADARTSKLAETAK